MYAPGSSFSKQVISPRSGSSQSTLIETFSKRRDRRHAELSVACLTEPMICQTRAGESGSWFGIAPNEASALATAFAIDPPIRDDRTLARTLDAEWVAR